MQPEVASTVERQNRQSDDRFLIATCNGRHPHSRVLYQIESYGLREWRPLGGFESAAAASKFHRFCLCTQIDLRTFSRDSAGSHGNQNGECAKVGTEAETAREYDTGGSDRCRLGGC